MAGLFQAGYDPTLLEQNVVLAKTAAEASKAYQESTATGLPKLLAELLAIKGFVDTEIAIIAGYTDTIESSLANTTYGLNAIKTKLDAVGTDAAAAKSYADMIDDATNGLAAIKAAINTANTTLGTVNTNTNTVESSLANTTYGLSAIKTKLDAVGTDAAAAKSYVDMIDDATNGLAAIKAAINAVNTTLGTVNTNTVRGAVKQVIYGVSGGGTVTHAAVNLTKSFVMLQFMTQLIDYQFLGAKVSSRTTTSFMLDGAASYFLVEFY